MESMSQQLNDKTRIGLNWQRRSKELQDKLNEISTTSGNVAEKEAEVAKLTTELQEARTKITTLEANISGLEAKLAEGQQSHQTKDAKVLQLETDLAAAQAAGGAAGAVAASTADTAELVSQGVMVVAHCRWLSRPSATRSSSVLLRLRKTSRRPRPLLPLSPLLILLRPRLPPLLTTTPSSRPRSTS